MVIIERIKVLIVDDIEIIVKSMHLYLSENKNIDFIYAFDGLEAYEKIKESKPNIVIINYKMQKMTGIEVIENVYKNTSIPSPYFLLTTGDIGLTNIKYPNIDILYKPFTKDDLLKLFSKLVTYLKK